MKSKCCKKFKRKGKGCKRCPVLAGLAKKQRKKTSGRINRGYPPAQFVERHP